MNDSYAPCKFSQSLTKFFFVVVRCHFIHFCFNLRNASLNSFFIAFTVNNPTNIFVCPNFGGFPQIGDFNIFKCSASIFRNYSSPSQNCNIIKHALSPIAKPRSFDGQDIKASPELVDNQSSQGFAFDIVGDDH